MNDTPFDTVGDEPVEARIVAWVLGESSAFEAAELERLCEERPELLVFRRRMRALNGLLTEAESAEPDHSWKLPPEKRKALDEIFGGEKVVPLDSEKDLRVRRISRRALLAIAACLILTIVVAGLTPPMVMRQRKRGGIDISGGSSFTLRDERPEEVKQLQSVPATRGMIVDPEGKIEEERNVAGAVIRSKASDESLARNGATSQYSDTQVQQLRPAPGQQPAPAAAPASPSGSTGKDDDSFAMSSKRQAGLKENARQLQPAKKPAIPQSVALAAEAAQELPALDAPSEIDALPQITTRSGLGGGAGGFRDARARVVPPPTQTAAAAEPEPQLLAKDSVLAAGERSTVSRELETLDEIPADGSMALAGPNTYTGSTKVSGGSLALGDRLDTDGDDNGAPVAGDGVTSGLRSGDQAIDRNSIDAILNNPSRVPAAASKAKGIKAESDAKPPVLAGREPATAPVAKPAAAAVGGALQWGGSMPKLAGSGTATGTADSLGNESTKLADEDGRSNKQDLGVVITAPSKTADQGQADLAGNLNSLGDVSPEQVEFAMKLKRGESLENASSGFADVSKISKLEEGEKSGQALTGEHALNVDKVRRELGTAEGNFNLGKYDDSKKAYEEALRTDPYNTAARRGLEKVEAAKSDYYRAAYDHTRAELLSQVDSAWELKVPADGKNQEFEGWVDNGAPVTDEESQDKGAAADSFAEAKRPPAELAGKEQGARAADLAERQQRLAILRRQLESPGDGKKQTLFREWKKLKKEIDEMTDEKPLAENDEAQAKLTDLMEEVPASENPYSTFSLNISDASFQLAKAALAKGERPDPESIKPEQFYNAVDYGDPAPSSNEPVAATIEQSAHPIIPGRNLVRVALRTGSAGRNAAQPLRLTLLVDQSGSMVRDDRRASMEHALAQLGVLLTKADLVTVIGFSRTPHLLAEGMTGDQAAKLGDLVNQTASEGGTNLEEAMKLGADKALRHQLAGAQNRIVLFTDGAANLGDANPERLAEQVKSLRQKGIAFDIAGIGADGTNDRLLSELARNGNGRYYIVGSENNDSFARQLAGAFRPAAENVKVQVNFNPQRVGKYKLIGFEKDRLKTEDFRNDAVDAAELAAEEAGVAIYQVEPLAEGTGELGEVSVRFRDAATGQMVERAWTIPYAAQATAFDRATPSMQLAGLSLLAAEKLKGGPLADAIDFKQLTGPGASVKQFYGSSPRVADMLRVIDALR